MVRVLVQVLFLAQMVVLVRRMVLVLIIAMSDRFVGLGCGVCGSCNGMNKLHVATTSSHDFPFTPI